MRQSLLVALAVLAWLGASPRGAALGAPSGQRPGATAEPAWSSSSGRESAPSPDATPPPILEGKREKNENDTEAPAGLGSVPDGASRLAPPSHSRPRAPRDRAAGLGPPARLARLRC